MLPSMKKLKTMAISQNEPVPILREWAPLTELLNKLPLKIQNGIFFQEVKLSCVDILPEYIALGTNVGIVYWYDRRKKDLQRLRCEHNIPITALKILSTVDYMVACGNKSGNISIFQIPKSHSESIPESLRPKNKQVERYTVMELHKAPISAIEWSKNGMNLFSGDKNGCIVSTEIDFYMHICKSIEILNESYEVVQLSYKKQQLLVSTTYRSIICKKFEKWKVCQVGKKDRKVLGSFGGIIFQDSCKPLDTFLYCTRPGLRMWISDIEGNVEKTLLFKELLTKECPEVPLLNPLSKNLRSLKPQRDAAFGILLPFNERLLLTYNNDVVYILDPQEMTILSTISQLRSVLTVATHKDEIFILEEDHSLIRISYRPESFNENFISFENKSYLPLSSSIKELTTKLQSTSIISAIPPVMEPSFCSDVNIHMDEVMVVNAEEARESPVKLQSNDPDTKKRFDEIGKQEFEEEILFKKSKKRKKRSNMTFSSSSLSSNSSEEKATSFTRPTIMNLSAVGALPDMRSPESIKYDIEYKEKILADVLNLDRVIIGKSDINKDKLDCDKTKKNNESNFEKKSISENVSNQEFQNETSSLSVDKKPKEKILLETKKKCGATIEHSSNVSFTKLKEDLTYKKPNDDVKNKNQGDKTPENRSTKDDQTVKGAEFVVKSHTEPKTSNDTPECMSIPNEWRLSDIQVRERTISVLSDNSLSDWEIV
ncbi:WD repeat-containing protein CG11141 isoform X2 [Leptinotarsa decemlineata]|uniref:WD repeat-containing protein CG11141 isoform X2 n=2 Tax=Leptinotarsa decemlineata TaxID=7539 RepID=UPI003D30C9F3